jgi:hypothetical protein
LSSYNHINIFSVDFGLWGCDTIVFIGGYQLFRGTCYLVLGVEVNRNEMWKCYTGRVESGAPIEQL